MTMVSSGEISIGGSATSGGLNRSINVELGLSATATSSLNNAAFRTLAGVPSGAISLSNFYGKTNAPPTLNWVKRTSLPWAGTSTLSSIAFGNGVFVGVNASGNAYYSSDGINWTLGNEVTASTNSLKYVGYGNGAFVAVTWFTSEIDYSTNNGANWYGATDPASGYSAGSVVYGDGQWICSLNGITLYSVTGPSSWSIAPYSPSSVVASDSMIYVGGYFYAGTGNSIYRSTGYNQPWTQVHNKGSVLVYGNGTFLGASITSNGVSVSTNGTSWTFNPYTTNGPKAVIAMTYGNGVFLAADADNDKVWISTDGTNWFTSLTTPFVSSSAALAYGNGVFVYADDDGTNVLYTAAY